MGEIMGERSKEEDTARTMLRFYQSVSQTDSETASTS